MPERKDQDHHHRHEHKRERDQHQERRNDVPHAHYPTPPQFRYPQNFSQQNFHPHIHQHGHHHAIERVPYSNYDYRQGGDFRRYQQHQFRNPYDGMNNFWNDRWEDNYYYDGHRHHHRHHHKDDFFPRLLEGIVGGILSGSIVRELDKLNEIDLEATSKDGKKKAELEIKDIDDNDVEIRRVIREDFTPDQQILLNLDLHAKTPAGEVNPRFERTG